MKTMVELIEWFQIEYPDIVKAMKGCNHHRTWDDVNEVISSKSGEWGHPINPYHVESDVFTHTMLVCKQAENAPYEVRIAALLHDIGKPDTRVVNPKNGRVSFYNHDAVGAFKALEILKREELGLSKEQQVHIFNLIALHTQVYKLNKEQLRAIGDRYLVEDLIKLGKADHEGRFHTKGDAEIPDIIDVFPEILSGVSSTKRMAQEKEVVVLVGLPASGKSTWYETHSDQSFLVSRDNCLMYHARQKALTNNINYSKAWEISNQDKVNLILENQFKEAKKQTQYDIVVDMTHMSKKSRRKSLSHFGPEYKKKAVVFLTDLPTLHLQNENRSGKIIGEDVIDRMMRSFYPPTYEEFDEIEYVL